jgi:creatinine amidohydrolase/Fe(II)-dependent formamide hydrolase-like protein
LWTVAVFLFGVLPLLRKRGIGRLLIGDEYDTTERASYQGITHYSGLYDQSRYFDDALSRYFGRKGYGISQFSILRPCSEILIEKVLAERYPALLEHQMSCHATHKDEAVVRPCGACEKCRRIVGMLIAVGQDPRRCGFREEQIESSLRSLVENGVHQERAGAAHMAHLLDERGRIAEPRLGKVAARPQPEVMKLRFDPERSPVSAIPVNLREPVFRILLQHAEGALQRRGRVWHPFDVLGSAEIRTPYRFEAGKEAAKAGAPEASFLLGELTWPEAQERFRQVDVALLPVGAIEQHGPHLPLDTDAFDADYLAKRVAASCPDPKPLVLPLLAYGVSYAHDDFSGTLSISPDTMARLVHEIGMSVARQGITKLVIVNGHGGNGPALHFAAQLINRDAHILTCVDTGETSDAEVNAMSDVPNDVHAGDIETSTTLAVRPELVRMDRAEKFIPRFSSKYLDFTARGGVGWYAQTAKITPTGVFGDPTRATREKGERMWEVMVEHLVALVTSIQGLSLDEIHQGNGARRAPSSPSGSSGSEPRGAVSPERRGWGPAASSDDRGEH